MFDGETIEAVDVPRLNKQLQSVFDVMEDANWRTLPELQERIPKATTQSLSARLRDFRKEKFGGFLVERRRITDSGLFEYRLDITRTDPKLEKRRARNSITDA